MTMTGKSLRKFLAEYKIVALLIVVALIWAFFAILTYDPEMGRSQFLTARNFSNLLRQMAITGMLASAMVFVIVAGEIDLSVGALLGLLGGIAAVLDVLLGWPLWATISTVLVLGVALGAFNGWLTAYLGIPSFIVTLGGQLVFRGIVLGIMGGVTIAPISPEFKYIGQGYLPGWLGNLCAIALFGVLILMTLRTRASKRKHNLQLLSSGMEVARLLGIGVLILGFILILNSYQGVPVPVLILLVILGVFTVIAKQTVFGRHIYAVGSNTEATRFSGVNVNFVKMAVFALMGLMAAGGRPDDDLAPCRGYAIGGHGRRTRRHRFLLHRRHVHARRCRLRARRTGRRAHHVEPRQRHVHARRRYVLAADHQGQHSCAGGLSRHRILGRAARMNSGAS